MIQYIYTNSEHNNPLGRVTPVENLKSLPLYDKQKYKEILLDAAETVLGYFGYDRTAYSDIKKGRRKRWYEKLKSTGNFKMLVSGDPIRAQNKFQHPFSFRNYAKLIFSANKIPEAEEQQYAYYRRWSILEFEKIFDDTRDTKLVEKLTTPEELSGLLNIALIALRKLRADNGFKEIAVEKLRQKYGEKSNSVKALVEACCLVDIQDPLYFTLTTDLYAAYCNFCEVHKERPLENNVFGKKLAAMGIENEKVQYTKGSREHCYLGVKLRVDIRGGNQQIV
jgi:phage/plasmid-associated DNA primase